MKFLFYSLILSLTAFACSVSTSPSLRGETDPTADQQSYDSLVNVKWCQPVPAQQTYQTSWLFLVTNKAHLIRTDVATKQVLLDQEVNWTLKNKILSVTDAQAKLIFTRNIAVFYDVPTAKNQMLWSAPNVADIALTECEK